jgi:hypothetical protein
MHRRMPSHFPRIGAFCPLAVRDAWFSWGSSNSPDPYESCAHLFLSRRKLSGLDCVCIRRHDGRHVEIQSRAGESDGQDSFGAYFDLSITSAAQNVAIISHKGNVKDPGPNDFLDPATQASNTGSFRAERTAYHATAHDPAIRSTDSRRQGAHSLSSPR